MATFFVNRPIVAIVIAIVTVIVGLVSMATLPVAQYPNIVPPQIQVTTSYTGADALTVEGSVATPIEQQVSGVDNMSYMYSVNANNGNMTLNVFFGLSTDPDTDQILTQMRVNQAQSQLPAEVNNFGVTTQKATTAPMLVVALYSPNGLYDATFLANYSYINLNDAMTRVPGISSVTVFGAGEYAMRIWVDPNQLAKLNIVVPEIIEAVKSQNKVNPAGQIGGEPVPGGQSFTYSVQTQGRLVTEEQFGNIVLRANPDGSMVRLRDVARVELGSQIYNLKGRFNGQPAAVVLLYQLPGSNALDAAKGVRELMAKRAEEFPPGLAYDISLDTTLAVTAGIEEIVKTLVEALILVIIVVFVFLQGWRATLIPLIAVPVSLIGTFIFFPMLGFSINTLSLFGMVLAIGLVVDDAIVVVEAVEHHIENGLAPKEATIKAMSEVTSPVIAIALILASVFIPTVFIPGITGELYQQFAITIAVSVLISAFNALTLSPALSAMLLRPKKEGSGGLLKPFYDWFNRMFSKNTDRYVSVCGLGIRKMFVSLLFLLLLSGSAGFFGSRLPPAFIPEEDQGYIYAVVQLPDASSLQRTSEACARIEKALQKLEGVESVTSIIGFNLLSSVQATYNGFFFITLDPWGKRKTPKTQYHALMKQVNGILYEQSDCIGFAFPPPAIPGVGTAGGITFMLEDRSGADVQFLLANTQKFMEAALKRPELGMVNTTALLAVPRIYADVNQDKVLKQGVDLNDVYDTLQAFMGGYFVNYFNRFGRQWQVYVQAEGQYRTVVENVGDFYVRNKEGNPVPLSSVISTRPTFGPEFTMRYNLHRCVQINASTRPGFSSAQGMKALEEVFAETMPKEMGYDYAGMSFQEQQAAKGVSPVAIFSLSFLFVFLILAAQYESWTLPFSVLLGVPIAVFGAFFALWSRGMENNIYAQIGLVMLIGLAAKNAILIVEFCRSEYEKGKPLYEAALAGARLRLRPILMTAFAFILGCVPLWTATGSGAVSRQVLGTTVIGGMLAATCIAIFIVPVTFYFVEWLTSGKGHGEHGLPEAAAPSSPARPEEKKERSG
jgi:HAE1 family hydrophobic/amphiphilic exporter-1